MKKIINFILLFAITLSFISCNKEKDPVNTTSNTAGITENTVQTTDTVPSVNEPKIFDFNEREKGENIYITLDDLKNLFTEAESIYREYDIIRGKILKHNYPLVYGTYEGEPKFEYYDTEIIADHETAKRFDELDDTLSQKELGECYAGVYQVFMMNITSFCKEGMVLSEYDKDHERIMHGSGVPSSNWYMILLYSETVPQEPNEIWFNAGIKPVMSLSHIVKTNPRIPTLELLEYHKLTVTEFREGFWLFYFSLE